MNQNIKLIYSTAILALIITSGQSHAATIYNEAFGPLGSTGSLNNAAIGWSAYENDTTNLSGSTGDPLYVFGSGTVTIGGSGANSAGEWYAMISDAASLDMSGYENDLAITWSQRYSFRNSDPTVMGWRALVEVSGEWYVSNFQQATTTTQDLSVTLSDSIWQSWSTAENNLTDGFSNLTANLDSATSLPSNLITGFGLMAVDNNNGTNQNLLLSNYSITGTTIVPEPSAVALLGTVLGITFLRSRRRI